MKITHTSLHSGITGPSRIAGFSMLEVLFTILLTSFGLLALAGMLQNGLRLNNSSYLRSLATQQAYDIADRMRANTPAVLAGSYNTVAYTANQSCTLSSTTSAGIATYDVCAWNNQNEKVLPSGQGTMTRAGNVFTITVSWDDTRSGSANKSVTVGFEP